MKKFRKKITSNISISAADKRIVTPRPAKQAPAKIIQTAPLKVPEEVRHHFFKNTMKPHSESIRVAIKPTSKFNWGQFMPAVSKTKYG